MFQLADLTNKYRLSLLAVSVASAMSAQAVAEDSTEEVQETTMIEIKGQATGGIDNLITSDDIEKLSANTLGEVFQLDPQVTAGGPVSMSQKLYVRGIGEDALNISVDGAEQAGGIFHHSGRVVVEPELLKQVEIEAGPGSSTVGFGGLGGAVRFVTKDPSDLLSDGENAGVLLKGTYFTNSDGYKWTSSAFARDESDTVSVLASFVRSEHNNNEDGNGDDVQGTDSSQKMSYAKLVANLSDEQKLSVSYEKLHEEGDVAFRSEWQPSSWNPLLPTEGNRDTAILNYEFDSATNDYLDLMINVYKTENEQIRDVLARGEISVGEMETYGVTVQNTSLVANHKLIYGINYRDDKSVYRNELNGAFDGQEEGNAKGVYIQDVIDVTQALTVSAGGRFDEYELEEASQKLDDSAFSPNLSANFEIISGLSVSAGYAQAFRGPEVKDSYRVYLTGPQSASNLKGETSTNLEMGVDYVNGGLTLSAGVYKLEIEDGIFYNAGTGMYQNLTDDIETDGYFARADYYWNGLNAMISYSSTDTQVGNQDAFRYVFGSTANSIGDTVVTDLSYEFTPDLVIGWTAEYTKGLDISVNPEWYDPRFPIENFRKSGYGVHDIYARWLPTSDEDLSLTLTAKNILDKQYLHHASTEDLQGSPAYSGIIGPYEQGRDVRLTAAVRF